MIKERKYYSFYNSFCEIAPEPSSKFSTSLSLKMDIYIGNFHFAIWIKSPVFVSTLTSARGWAIETILSRKTSPCRCICLAQSQERARNGAIPIWILSEPPQRTFKTKHPCLHNPSSSKQKTLYSVSVQWLKL